MDPNFLKYFDKQENSRRCKCLIVGCKSQTLTFIKGNLKRHLMDSHPSVAKQLNLKINKRKISIDSSTNESSTNELTSNNNDFIRTVDEEELNSETTDKKRMRMSSNSKIENQSMDVTDDDKFEFDDDLSPNSRLFIQNLLKKSEERVMNQISSAFKRQYKILSKMYSLAKSSSTLPIKHPENVDHVQEVKLSFNTHKELVSFENKLGKDNIYRNQVIEHLIKYSNHIGHRSKKLDRVHQLLDEIMTPKLKEQYSWSGRERALPKEKKFNSFSNVFKLIFDVICTFKINNGMDMTQVKIYVKDYFKTKKKIDTDKPVVKQVNTITPITYVARSDFDNLEDRNKKLQQKLDEVLKIFEIPKQKKSRFEDESSDDESNDYESFDDDSIDETSESSRASTPLKNIKRDKPVTRSGNLDSENEQFVNTNIEIKEENINETVPFDPFDPLSSSTSHHQLI